jgi:fluoride exporter
MQTRSTMDQLLWVCLGGAIGSGARFVLSSYCRQLLGASFPYGTFAVNVLGSFLIGIIMRLGTTSEILPYTVRLTLGTGVMGGFTTYSSFNYETLQLLEDGALLLGLINILLTLVGCLVAGWLGLATAKSLMEP